VEQRQHTTFVIALLTSNQPFLLSAGWQHACASQVRSLHRLPVTGQCHRYAREALHPRHDHTRCSPFACKAGISVNLCPWQTTRFVPYWTASRPRCDISGPPTHGSLSKDGGYNTDQRPDLRRLPAPTFLPSSLAGTSSPPFKAPPRLLTCLARQSALRRLTLHPGPQPFFIMSSAGYSPVFNAHSVPSVPGSAPIISSGSEQVIIGGSDTIVSDPPVIHSASHKDPGTLEEELALARDVRFSVDHRLHSYYEQSRLVLSRLQEASWEFLRTAQLARDIHDSTTTEHLASGLHLMRLLVESPSLSPPEFVPTFRTCLHELYFAWADLVAHEQRHMYDQREDLHTALLSISTNIQAVQAILRRTLCIPSETKTVMSASQLTDYLRNLQKSSNLPDPSYTPRQGDQFIVTKWEGSGRVAIARVTPSGEYFSARNACVKSPRRRSEDQFPPELDQVCSSCARANEHDSNVQSLCVTLPYLAKPRTRVSAAPPVPGSTFSESAPSGDVYAL